MPEYEWRHRHDSVSVTHDRLGSVSQEENILLQNNGVRSQIVDATLMRSFLCDHVEVVELTTNLRLLTESHSDEREFANYLLDGGNGNISVEQSLGEFKIKLPNDSCLVSGTLSDRCDFVYADFKNNFTNPVWLTNCTIVTPKNETTQFVNDFLLIRIPGELKIYRTSDTVDNETLYQTEFINKLRPLGFPLHILKLKKKRWLMLLRNLDATNGHCNGTHYIIVSLHDHVIEAEVASGSYAESTLLIPRIPHVTQEMEFPFTLEANNFLSSQLLP
ncbi:uncharacterized protein LOC128247660 [Octopus bimaculoides]|uniref:ATP-dependent DNA helicase n=1 Tax=Octopus bimaculoides TaxID=37653 RepID=A0A0L8I1J0_OCTBM|nr:uncharacterized protein LOC128247660 [Octopus bimaculoides]